jgi:probable HAF family extracellular repeat protein
MRVLILLSVVCAALLASGARGQATASQASGSVDYHVSELPSLGGSSAGYSINNRGWVAGRSGLSDLPVRHATLWRDGSPVKDLGTLGSRERNSVVRWPVKNVRGLITGISQTDEPDMFGENWSCSAFFPPATATGYRCIGFKWQNGVMTALPTLAEGVNGFAAGSNNAGQIVGWSETSFHDPTCETPQVLQFLPVVWEPTGQIRKLRLLPDDDSGAATAINDVGQAVGISGICDQAVGRFTARHAVIWDAHGNVTKLPTLDGVAWHTPNAINRDGDVVGFGNFSAADGGNYHPHAFLWTKQGGIRDLETLPAPFDDTSEAWGINNSDQVVGRSCDVDGNCHAFLWQDGKMTGLTEMASGDAEPIAANDIDDFGRITGQAFDVGAGAFVAYLATPASR